MEIKVEGRKGVGNKDEKEDEIMFKRFFEN